MFLSDRKSTLILTEIFISFFNLKFNFYMFDTMMYKFQWTDIKYKQY